jgi:hypothetical protein
MRMRSVVSGVTGRSVVSGLRGLLEQLDGVVRLLLRDQLREFQPRFDRKRQRSELLDELGVGRGRVGVGEPVRPRRVIQEPRPGVERRVRPAELLGLLLELPPRVRELAPLPP